MKCRWPNARGFVRQEGPQNRVLLTGRLTGDPEMRSLLVASFAPIGRGQWYLRDRLGGSEGSFLICTFWLAEAQARAGRVQEARAFFERAVSYANDLGLLSEEVDTATGELIGNFPQAFSHTGLVNAAWAISQADHVGPVGPEVAAG